MANAAPCLLAAEAAPAAAAVLGRHAPAPAPAPPGVVGSTFTPRQLGWDVPGARSLRLTSVSTGAWTFEVEGSTRAASSLAVDWVKDGSARTPLLRHFDAEGRLLRWELAGREGAEGEFDEKGALAIGRSWRGPEQTVTLRAADDRGRPQLHFHKYRQGRKIGVRVVTLDPATLKAAEIREFDAAGRLVRIATITKEGRAEVSEPGRKLVLGAETPPPPPAARKPPAKPPVARRPRPLPDPTPPEPPRPKILTAPPGALLTSAADGAFSSAAAAVRRFGPAVARTRRLTVHGSSGPETWLVRREAGGRPLEREEVENELVMREVLKSFYAELFEAPPAVGFESGARVALVERLAAGSPVQRTFRPFAPKERAALATLSLVFGLGDLGPERFRWSEGRRPQLTGLGSVRRAPARVARDERPLILVELRLGRLPFLRASPALPLENYREEAGRVAEILRAPGFAEGWRERLERAGLTPEQAKAYCDAVNSNLSRFEVLLAPYLEAASALEELTDAGR